MILSFRALHPNAVLPKFAHDSDQCFDLTAISRGPVTHKSRVYQTGLAVSIPKGYGVDIFIRSSLAFNKDFMLTNGVGKIDQGYTGPIAIKLTYIGDGIPDWPMIGVRIAQGQLNRLTKTNIKWTESTHDTERGSGGFGSTGK